MPENDIEILSPNGVNETELRKMQGEYSQKYEAVNSAISQMQSSARNTRNDAIRKDRQIAAERGSQSMVPGLYDNLAKNAETVNRLGTSAFPNLNVSFNNETGVFTIPNSPETEKALNGAFLSLYKLAKTKTTRTDSNGKETSSCFTTHVDGPRMTDELSKNKRSPDLSDVPLLDLSEKGAIRQCTERKCNNCNDCGVHKEELLKALKGLTTEGSSMHQVHLKNLITVLGSWAAHQDSTGGTKATRHDPAYHECRGDHAVLATFLHLAAHRLKKAYEYDYRKSGGRGGGRHKDHFIGQGNDTGAY
jgi:hypothetical protein